MNRHAWGYGATVLVLALAALLLAAWETLGRPGGEPSEGASAAPQAALAKASEDRPEKRASTRPSRGIETLVTTIRSGGRDVRLEKFLPAGEGRHPVIMILHGSRGMKAEGEQVYRMTAAGLAARGYVAVLLHYFDRTGTTSADIDMIHKNFAAWVQTVDDAVAAVGRMPHVDPARIGLLGFSLGGYLSLAAASQNQGIAAVVEYFGGLPDVLVPTVRHMPPVLILHGDQDNVVPVTEARKVENLLRGLKLAHEARIYAGQGHGFTGLAAIDAAWRTVRFFDRHLRSAEAPPGTPAP